ncbi:ROK family glucokinase [Eubacterium oxidoreducens]|uniref:Glucokinase n=1 Tax=Eubacterium oxidoreducens TaxID=1732 RepID=A0A1G6A5G5_EUBOX|nr:ROK family glucokinase [Eubacterium oxidoreducens]SDB03658.1 glucokinase [Eubacterium oxidoreducens]
MKKYAFGVDIGGTTVKMGLFYTDGKILEKWEIPSKKNDANLTLLDDIADEIRRMMQHYRILAEDIAGIGMGIPGPVGWDGTVYKCINLGWDVINVEREMKNRCGLDVKVGNDANVAALGEMWMGGAQGFSSLVMVTVGTGVGAGVIIDGHIVSGANGAAGEIGHITVCEDETRECACGKYGCLEQYASANGIVSVCQAYLQKSKEPSVLRAYKQLTAKNILDAAKEGDALALKMVEQFARTLGKVLAEVATVINPQVFVIGGGVAKAGEIVTNMLKKQFMEYSFHAARDTKFALAKLGNDAGIYGGVKLVLDLMS